MAAENRPELLRAADSAARMGRHSHPWNPKSEITGVQLSRIVGLERTGVSLARIAPGKESFVYHSHAREEEWLYILSGTGTAEIDGGEYEVGPGDFMGFPTPSVAHHLRNTGTEDLVYLMGARIATPRYPPSLDSARRWSASAARSRSTTSTTRSRSVPLPKSEERNGLSKMIPYLM